VTGSVSKKWLIRLKKRLMKKVTLDWDKVGKASGKATFLVCAKHNSMIGMLMFFYFVKGLFYKIFTVLRRSGMFIPDPNFSIPYPWGHLVVYCNFLFNLIQMTFLFRLAAPKRS
jgi:hypothetical protein